MKTVKIELPDDKAEALERAATEAGYAFPSELVLAALDDFLAYPAPYDAAALARDIARHEAEKWAGDRGA